MPVADHRTIFPDYKTAGIDVTGFKVGGIDTVISYLGVGHDHQMKMVGGIC